jgi:hypothetical protein
LFEDDELRAVAAGQCPWAMNTCEKEREREPETMTARLSDRVGSKLN